MKTKQSKTTRTTKTSKKPSTPQRKSLAHHAVHHAKRAYHLTPKFIHGMVAGAFVGIIVVSTMTVVDPTSALSISSTRDCSTNAVLKCGALSTAEVQQKYPQTGAATIYNYYGISATDVANLSKTAVAGVAKKDGTVVVSGKVVATGASSTGRERIHGSHAVTYGGLTFYETTSQLAFRSDSIAVFVVMKNGLFDFAIMGACGNPVKGTPTTKPTPPPPHPTPPPPATPPPATPPPPTPVTPVPTPAPVELPNAGPGAVILIALLSIIGGYIFHIKHRHKQIKRQHAKHTKHVSHPHARHHG